MTAPVLVVGAGPSGLGCAIELVEHLPVVVIDRIPVAGGAAGWDHPDIRRFAQRASRLGVRLLLGESALRWADHRLLIAGPRGSTLLEGAHLFMAGGLRPATLANLRVTGDRPAGILPATVAEHLLHTGVRLWNTALVAGNGPWAATVAEGARRLGTRIIAFGGQEVTWSDERYDWPGQWSIVGRDRVTAVRAHLPSGVLDLPCDAVILAADPVPNRNVDGAVLDDSDGVTFVQPLSPADHVARFHAAQATARQWLHAQEEVALS